jgi:RecB family exonuclease
MLENMKRAQRLIACCYAMRAKKIFRLRLPLKMAQPPSMSAAC